MCSLLACAGVTPILRVYGAHVPCVRIRGWGGGVYLAGVGERGGGVQSREPTGVLGGDW